MLIEFYYKRQLVKRINSDVLPPRNMPISLVYHKEDEVREEDKYFVGSTELIAIGETRTMMAKIELWKKTQIL